jgi:exopolysaccharide biosynthesis predicted pyruvyltransferase EpsI
MMGSPDEKSRTSTGVVDRLQATVHSVLSDYYTDLPYALLDFPDHPNVGDSAIWAGEVAYLRRYWKREPSYVCTSYVRVDCKALADAVAHGPILLHGGGNFGDVWPNYQRFRETVLDHFPNHTIVQLPQSIQFDDPASLRRTAQVVARHRSFVLLVRDQASYELASSHFDCTVRLCPDMAFCLGPMARPTSPIRSLVMLLRSDKEVASTAERVGVEVPADALVTDWLQEPDDTLRRARMRAGLGTIASLISLNPRQLSPMARRVRRYDQLATLRIRRGVRLLSQGRQIISDRLHAHILGTLLGIPQIMLDNNYGKISRFMSTWQSDWVPVQLASDLASALSLAEAPADSSRQRVAI